MSYIAITKFSQHQHYKNRRPPWVKFYVSLLDPHHPINALPIATRYLFDRLLLLAANYDNAIPNDFELIARLLRMPPRACREGLAELEQGRWIKVTRTPRRASKVARGSLPPETETETEKVVISSTSTNGYIAPTRAIDRLLKSLTDADAQTAYTIQKLARRHRLAEGDFEWARECANGPGVESPSAVAVAELRKRGEQKGTR